MKYGTKFMIPDNVPISKRKDFVEWGKMDALCALGRKIGERHQFEENGDVLSIELQVFSQKRWIEFKRQLSEYSEASKGLGISALNNILFAKMIKELENEINEQPTKQ